jgi:protein TonB
MRHFCKVLMKTISLKRTLFYKKRFLNSFAISAAIHIALLAFLLQCHSQAMSSCNVFCGNGGLVGGFFSAADFMGTAGETPEKKEQNKIVEQSPENKTALPPQKEETKPAEPVVEEETSSYASEEDAAIFFDEWETALAPSTTQPDIAQKEQPVEPHKEANNISEETANRAKSENNEAATSSTSHSRIGAIAQNGTASPIEMSIAPHYPVGSRIRGEEGIVKVQVLVAENGTPLKTSVLTSSGFSALDQAALKAVSKAKFKPAIAAGKPMQSEAQLTFRFCLEN